MYAACNIPLDLFVHFLKNLNILRSLLLFLNVPRAKKKPLLYTAEDVA